MFHRNSDFEISAIVISGKNWRCESRGAHTHPWWEWPCVKVRVAPETGEAVARRRVLAAAGDPSAPQEHRQP